MLIVYDEFECIDFWVNFNLSFDILNAKFFFTLKIFVGQGYDNTFKSLWIVLHNYIIFIVLIAINQFISNHLDKFIETPTFKVTL